MCHELEEQMVASFVPFTGKVWNLEAPSFVPIFLGSCRSLERPSWVDEATFPPYSWAHASSLPYLHSGNHRRRRRRDAWSSSSSSRTSSPAARRPVCPLVLLSCYLERLLCLSVFARPSFYRVLRLLRDFGVDTGGSRFH